MDKEQISRAETIAKIAKTGGTVVSIFDLIKMILAAIVITGIISFFMLLGLPWYIGIPFIVFVIILVILQIIRIKRISSARI